MTNNYPSGRGEVSDITMTKEELQFILEEGEGLTIEFKQSFDKSIAKEMVAFTNAIGGKIFLGISDDREIKGIEITNRIKSQIFNIAQSCDPSIKVTIKELDNILIVDVKEEPYQCSAGLEEPEFDLGDFFTATFKGKIKSEIESDRITPTKTTQKSPQITPQKITHKTITVLENKILDKIRNEPQITRDEIALKLHISPNTAKEYLKRLKDKGLLQRIGPDRGGYWKVIKNR